MHPEETKSTEPRRRQYEKPEVILLRVRQEGDSVLGACKQTFGAMAVGASTFCEACSTFGS